MSEEPAPENQEEPTSEHQALTGPVRLVGQDPELDLDRPMSLVEHLEDLRRALIYIFASVILSTAVAFIFHERLLRFFLAPGRPVIGPVVINSITGPLMIYLEVSFVGGLLLSLPVVLWALWGFLRPALKRRERRYISGFVATSYVFFVLGGVFAYLVIPIALRFLVGFANNGDFRILITADSYITFLLVVIVLLR
jgi:sec-independent protein translocase protein TatC